MSEAKSGGGGKATHHGHGLAPSPAASTLSLARPPSPGWEGEIALPRLRNPHRIATLSRP